jgi:hypothetical protein
MSGSEEVLAGMLAVLGVLLALVSFGAKAGEHDK